MLLDINNIELLEPYKSKRRQVTGGVNILGDGSTVTRTLLPNETLSSFSIENSIPQGKYFGFVVTNKLQISLIEKLELEKGTALQPYISTVGATESAALPIYYVDTVEIDDTNKTTTITAYDGLYKTKEMFMRDIEITYPISLSDFATTLGNLAGYAVAADFTDVDFTLEEATVNIDGSESVYDIFEDIAEVTGTICRCASGWTLEFKPLSRVRADIIDKNNYFDFKSQPAETLTGISSATQLGENLDSGNANDFVQVIWDNTFLELREDAGILLDAIAARVVGITMVPYSLTYRGNPYYQPGECLAVETDTGFANVYYFNEKTTYGGGLKTEVSWVKGEQEQVESNPTNLGESIKNTYAKVDKQNKQIELVAGEADVNAEAIAALKINTDSIAASVSKIEQTTNEGLDTIHSDIETLTKQVEATVSAEDVQLQIKSELANGVDKVTTSTGFTFNEEGLTVSKEGSEMTTNIDEDGMAVYRNSEEVLTANNEGVIAYNLHAKTYLIIGENSRLEDYEKDGNPRTGCFWIGGTN